MKKLLLILLLLKSLNVSACDQSFISLDSVVYNSTSVSMYVTLCVGSGITGSVQGGDNATSTFGFAIYSTNPINIVGFSPAVANSPATGCNLPGQVYTNVLGANTFLAYISPGCSYACVSSTAGCGLAMSLCNQFVIETDILPDSLRVLGAEGNGNPYAGCYPDNDMMVSFPVGLGVDWINMKCSYVDDRIRGISWETISEENNDYFEVQRMTDGDNIWQTIDVLDGSGTTNEHLYYNCLDEEFLHGKVPYYRIKQVDFDGEYKYSSIMSVKNGSFGIGELFLVPNPTKDYVSIMGLNPERSNLSMFSALGKEYRINISSTGVINTSMLEAGVYFICVVQENDKRTLKLIVK